MLARARPDFAVTDETAPALAEICIRLDGLPLALELAAPRLKMLAPETLLERLGRRLDIVALACDVLDRQRTLRATIAWSHELLASRSRSCSRDSPCSVAGSRPRPPRRSGLGRPDSRRGLAADAGELDLVVCAAEVASGPRLRMLETIREYGLSGSR